MNSSKSVSLKGKEAATLSWGHGLLKYLNERFPPLANGLLILSFYSSNQFVAQAFTNPTAPLRHDWSVFLGCITLLGFFLHMRIFDDHKDFESDCEHFPERTLQRGEVTLGRLRLLAVIVVGVEFLCATLVSWSSFVSLGIAFIFSLLMLKEFFVRDWLRRRFVLYASVHMLIMPLLSLTVYSFATKRFLWEAPNSFWLFTLVSYLLAFNWEISRKIRAPEEEVSGLDSYTQRFGTFRAAYLVLLVRIVDTSLMAVVGWMLGLTFWFYLFLVLLFLICMIGFLQFRLYTTPRTARQMEVYAGLYILAFDLAIVVEVGRLYGIQWGGSF